MSRLDPFEELYDALWDANSVPPTRRHPTVHLVPERPVWADWATVTCGLGLVGIGYALDKVTSLWAHLGLFVGLACVLFGLVWAGRE